MSQGLGGDIAGYAHKDYLLTPQNNPPVITEGLS
jgi:hypothetical protein